MLKRINEKEERFKEAWRSFHLSNKTPEDYFDLFAVVNSVTHFGDGLMFGRLKELMLLMDKN
jgi:hypothetical protein